MHSSKKKDLGKFEQKISHLDYGHINDLQHMCLEEIFGSTSKPPNDQFDVLLKIFGKWFLRPFRPKEAA